MHTASLSFQRVTDTVFAMHGWRAAARWVLPSGLLLSAAAQLWRMLQPQAVLPAAFGTVALALVMLALWQFTLTLAPQQLQVSAARVRLRYRCPLLDRLAGWQIDMRALRASPLRLVYEAQPALNDPLSGLALLMPGHRVFAPRVLPAHWQVMDETKPRLKLELLLPSGRPNVQASRWTGMAVSTGVLLDSLDERVAQLPLVEALMAQGVLIAPVARSGWMIDREGR